MTTSEVNFYDQGQPELDNDVGLVLRYDDNASFNESLDQSGEIVIANAKFQPSAVLFRMEPDTYRLALQEFKQQQLDEFKEIVWTQFPMTVAYPLYRAEFGYENHIQRLHHLRDIWEGLIYTLYALVIGEFRCVQIPLLETKLTLKTLQSDKPSDKLMIIERLLNLALDHGYSMISSSIVPISVIQQLRNLNQRRNGFSHKAALSEEQARQLYSTYVDDVMLALQQLEGLRKVTFLRLHSIDSNVTQPRFEVFLGHATTKTLRSIVIPEDHIASYSPLLNKDMILVNCGETLFSASPFLHFIEDGKGRETKLCVYKQKRDDKGVPRIVYEVVGNAEEISLNAPLFDKHINELKKLLETDSLKEPSN